MKEKLTAASKKSKCNPISFLANFQSIMNIQKKMRMFTGSLIDSKLNKKSSRMTVSTAAKR